jgi:hypothetical protein
VREDGGGKDGGLTAQEALRIAGLARAGGLTGAAGCLSNGNLPAAHGLFKALPNSHTPARRDEEGLAER